MSDLLSISIDVPISPHLSFNNNQHKNGWGIAWYPENNLKAAVIRDPSSGRSSGLTEILADWNMIRTPLLMSHLRGGTFRASFQNTHPFVTQYRGSSWTISHTGELNGNLKKELPIEDDFPLRPVGDSDSEHLFLWILSEINKTKSSTIKEFGYGELGSLFARANQLGTLNVQISDGRTLFTYRCSSECNPIYWTRFKPNEGNDSNQRYTNGEITLDLNNFSSQDYCFAIVSSVKFNGDFEKLAPGEYIALERGSVVHRNSVAKGHTPAENLITLKQGPYNRYLQVIHTTTYNYKKPVERSSHRLRLKPISDTFQQLVDYSLDISVNGFRYNFEDVFGNQVSGLDLDATYNKLTISMAAGVKVSTPVDRPELLPEKQLLPIGWMPWQAKMMQSYLLPPELPESQLRELTDYARSFSVRNKGELLLTLDDITRTIYSDYVYKKNSTTIETTPFEVYESRKGVCQDFANLMICLARMLNIPARYRVGYIYTGSDYENTEQSEASHAWVEAYLPMLGWRGYDPTNGAKVSGDHVRVAAGRNYRDATPTSGVIFLGGGGETMSTNVQVVEL